MAKTVYPASKLSREVCKQLAAKIRLMSNPHELYNESKNNVDMMTFLGCDNNSGDCEIWFGIREQWRAIKKEKI